MHTHFVINQEVFVCTHFLCFLRTPPVVIFPKHSFINEIMVITSRSGKTAVLSLPMLNMYYSNCSSCNRFRELSKTRGVIEINYCTLNMHRGHPVYRMFLGHYLLPVSKP